VGSALQEQPTAQVVTPAAPLAVTVQGSACEDHQGGGLGTPSERYGTVTTTLPRLCPLSTYLCAATMSSRA
jgi:hypothetical protein